MALPHPRQTALSFRRCHHQKAAELGLAAAAGHNGRACRTWGRGDMASLLEREISKSKTVFGGRRPHLCLEQCAANGDKKQIWRTVMPLRGEAADGHACLFEDSGGVPIPTRGLM
jgi:hypothetical protein